MTADAPTLLLVEDDPVLRTFLADNLTADGYELVVADTLRDGLRELEYKRPDLAIVDLGLPDGSGLDLIGRVRAADGVASRLDPALPLVVLSGRSSEIDRVRGFERGADDFVVKPFSYTELRFRLAAVLRRTRERRGRGRLRVGELELDPASREVRLRGRRIELSQKEFALLRALAAEPTRVWTKNELLRDVWGFRSLGTTRTLDSHACRLRHKLAAQGDRFVVNVWGVGYRLIDGPIASGGRPLVGRSGRVTVGSVARSALSADATSDGRRDIGGRAGRAALGSVGRGRRRAGAGVRRGRAAVAAGRGGLRAQPASRVGRALRDVERALRQGVARERPEASQRAVIVLSGRRRGGLRVWEPYGATVASAMSSLFASARRISMPRGEWWNWKL
jgi:DNA-binding response OmpR family regulator